MDLKEIVKNLDKKDIPDLMEMLERKASQQIMKNIKKTGVFKAKVKDGKLEIPEAEMEAMELEEDELVQAVVRKFEK